MSEKASDGRNRRRFPRVPVRGEVSGRIHTVAAAPVLDLSEGGALLEVPCALRPRSFYSFRLSLGEGRVLALQSSVVRSYVHSFESVGDGETRVQYRAAIQFINLSDADRELLRTRLYGSPEAVEGEPGAVPHDHSPEELLADLLATESWDGVAPPPLDGLSALLEESEPHGGEPAAAAAGSEPLPPLPDVEPLPALPDVEPLPAAPGGSAATAPEPMAAAKPGLAIEPPAGAPTADAASKPQPFERAAAEAVAETPVQAARPPATEPAPLPMTEPAGAAPSPAAAASLRQDATVEATPEVVPRQPTPHPSAWQRIKGWISSKPASERARGSSILGLGLDQPAPGIDKPLGEERRDSARVPVEGAVAGEMGLVMQSDIEALSVGGLMARMPFAPQNGSDLSFTIEVDGRPIVVGGTVRNVQQVRGDAGDVEYKVGLEFGSLDDDVRAILKDYVDRRLEAREADGAPLD